MATIQEYDTDALGARWHRVRLDPVSMVAWLAPWQLARDTVAAMIDRGEIDVDDAPTMLHTVHARVTSASTRELRALHSWFHGGTVHGETDTATPAPDGFERVRAQRRTERTNRGETVELVTVHGRAAVQGRTNLDAASVRHMAGLPVHAWTVHALTSHVSHALASLPRATFGADALAIARATDRFYGDALPDLIGGDVLTWHEFSTWDETRARTPRRGHGTRRRLPAVRARNGEVPEPRETFADYDAMDVPAWTPVTVHELLAPADDDARAWVGHRLTVRPVTVREQRATGARAVDGSVIVRESDDLAVVLAELAAMTPDGARLAWTHGQESGGVLTVSRDKRGRRYNVTGLPAPVKNLRTQSGLAAAIARAQSVTM